MREQRVGDARPEESIESLRPRSGGKRAVLIIGGLISAAGIYVGGSQLEGSGINKLNEGHVGFSTLSCENGPAFTDLTSVPYKRENAVFQADRRVLGGYLRAQIEEITKADLDSRARLAAAHRELAELICKEGQINDASKMTNSANTQALNRADKEISIGTAETGLGNSLSWLAFLVAGAGVGKGLFGRHDRVRTRKEKDLRQNI